MPEARAEQEKSWSDWMLAAQQGDRASYERLLHAIVPFIKTIARRRVHSPEAVEDVVQDTLLTVHRVRHTYDSGRPFAPWLTAIALRRAVDRARRDSRLEAREVLDDELTVTFPDPQTNREEDQQAEATEVTALLTHLPAGQRRALELLKLQELSLREASAITGQSEGSLKVAVHRALHTLRRHLAAKAPFGNMPP
jgi:RNA polymerase sigma-70 factor, ECF subfamily